jgi:peptidoglycan-associated lipoprotein
MKKNGWMAWCLIAVLAAALMLNGCAGTQEMAAPTEPAVDEGAGMEGSEVITEEILPIQPKEMKNIYFDFDRYDLSPDDRAVLADNAAWLENNPGSKVQIQGHCDDRGSNEYNLALGDRRAKSAYNYLINLGVSPSRISTISYGEEMPDCSQRTEECWAKNRRAHFEVK